MHPDAFAAARGPAWDELAALTSVRRPTAGDVLRLGARYREAAADLAYARRRFGDDPVTRRLETLVLRARPLVYGARPRGGSLRAYLARGYWRAVAERPKPLIAAWLLMVLPAVLAGLWALSDPSAAGGLVPADLRSVSEPQHHGLALHGAGEHAGVSIGIFVNNIQVTFLAYAGGLTLGLLTGYVLATNGILLGAVAGLAAGAGNGGDLLRLVVGHGVLELSCIAVTAAAGLRVGWSLVEPGAGTRAEALRAEAGRSIGIVLGTMPWLVLAGLVEGFVTGTYSTAVVLPLGIALGALYWGLVLTLGRAPSPARTR
ncbi:MAG TPA: stage II sporulation protein M [Gaiellales bacterium]|jgi:uncharacterized membrane protein SpoIIM required for sporulation|nr:stage II sporulation protein M [Gaiellales bacterium]